MRFRFARAHSPATFPPLYDDAIFAALLFQFPRSMKGRKESRKKEDLRYCSELCGGGSSEVVPPSVTAPPTLPATTTEVPYDTTVRCSYADFLCATTPSLRFIQYYYSTASRDRRPDRGIDAVVEENGPKTGTSELFLLCMYYAMMMVRDGTINSNSNSRFNEEKSCG